VETSPINIKSSVHSEGKTFSATEGGLLKYESGIFSHITSMDGLAGNILNAITKDGKGYLWLGGGAPDGFIQIFNPVSNQSIEIFNYDLTSISHFAVSDSIVIATYTDGQDLGLMKWLWINDKWQYSDIYKNFPLQFFEISDVKIYNNVIYLGTDRGLWMGEISDNLKNPNSWTLIFDDLISSVSAMAIYEDKMSFSHENTLYEFSLMNPADRIILESGTGIHFISLAYDLDESLWGISESKLYNLSSNFVSESFNRILQNMLFDDEGETILGTDAGFIFYDKTLETYSSIIPNAPVTNHFTAIKVLEDGRVVCGSKHGLSILDENGWRNILEIKDANSEIIQSEYDYSGFIGDTLAVDFGEYIADIEQGPNGRVYCAIRGTRDSLWWGGPMRYSGGVIHLDIDDPSTLEIINSSSLDYFSGDGNNYQVVFDLEFDIYGNLWIANPFAVHKQEPIHVFSPSDSSWYHYKSTEANGHLSQTPGTLVFDQWRRLWVGAIQASEANAHTPNGGLFMLDYFGPTTDPSSFNWVSLIEGGSVWSIAMGQGNRLFYLTPNGLNYYDIRDSSSPIERENLYAFFPNISFGPGSKLKTDPRGNIWAISPSDGIHVLQDNTTPWPDINGIRQNNSQLTSDEVVDVDFDAQKGLVYIITSNGLNILRVPFKEAFTTYNEMKIYPSPFHVPSDKPLIVDGLKDESSMMVMTVNGKVLRKIPSSGLGADGYQLKWDGKDDGGNWLGSGVYLLSIYDLSGESTFGKITVIRH